VSKVTIYQFTLYDITTDGYRKSRRWATREAIERLQGEVLERTEVSVDERALASDIAGMTTRDFNPHANAGFQHQVLP
jgi:hypothetical protein